MAGVISMDTDVRDSIEYEKRIFGEDYDENEEDAVLDDDVQAFLDGMDGTLEDYK